MTPEERKLVVRQSKSIPGKCALKGLQRSCLDCPIVIWTQTHDGFIQEQCCDIAIAMLSSEKKRAPRKPRDFVADGLAYAPEYFENIIGKGKAHNALRLADWLIRFADWSDAKEKNK